MNISRKKLIGLISTVIILSMLSGVMLNGLQASQTAKVTGVSLVVPQIIGTCNIVVRSGDGTILYNETSTKVDPLTQTGSSFIISQLGNTSEFASGAGTNLATNLCLSNDSTPLVTWTTLPTLISANGLSPANATATYGWCTTASGQSQYMILTHTWTCATANENNVQCMGVCYVAACTSGLICANTFSPPCNLGYANSDTIAGTYFSVHELN